MRTGVNCQVLAKGNSELNFTLDTNVKLDEAKLAGAWWSRTGWSSEDTWKMPEKLYGLEDLVLPVLKERATKASNWGSVIVHVQRD